MSMVRHQISGLREKVDCDVSSKRVVSKGKRFM
jgi:hypothetical protein